MIGLVIILAGVVLIAFGLTARHYADQVIDEVLAAEQRGIERDRVREQHAANVAARWQG